MRVEPRGSTASSPRTITQQRVARQPQLAHPAADHRVARRDRVLDDLGAEAPDRAALGQRARQRRLVAGHARAACERLEGRALDERRHHHGEEDDVEELAAP